MGRTGGDLIVEAGSIGQPAALHLLDDGSRAPRRVCGKSARGSCKGGCREGGRRHLDPASAAEVFRPALVAELQERPYEFDIQVQLCVDLERMPVEDVTVEWPEALSPFVTVAKMRLPQQDISGEDIQKQMDATSITPWRVTEEHRPLGNIMRARKEVYRQSSLLRHELNHQIRREPKNLAEVFGNAPV